MNNFHNHHRKSIRLNGYDYSQEGLYFITICTQDRIHLFGKIENGKMILNELGKIAAEEWMRTPIIRKNISLGEFVIMPNHIHTIIEIDYQIENTKKNIGKFQSPSHNIGAIIRGYKGATTKQINIIHNKINLSTGVLQYAPTEDHSLKGRIAQINKKSIWQRNYWEHIIRNEDEYLRIANYIQNNPVKWQTDKLNAINRTIAMENQPQYGEEIWMV